MDKRFFKLFDLTEEQAIAILDLPPNQDSEQGSRYVAASHLVNFPTERSIQALIRAVKQSDPCLENRIARRKALETLGRLQASEALPAIRTCLQEVGDKFTIENAVWAIGEIGTDTVEVLEEICQLLVQPGQNYRVIIQTLAKLGHQPACEQIAQFVNYPEPPVVSAALSGLCQLTGDTTSLHRVVAFLQHPKVMARRLAIQDLIDAGYSPAIPDIARCPVSLVFRLRAIRALATAGIAEEQLSFSQIQPHLEQTLRDHPTDLSLVDRYPSSPELESLIRELYNTDFGRCYLAASHIIRDYPQVAPEALLQTYREEACADYGAHFHVVKLLGWLRYAPAYDLFIEALQNPQPQFQKSRAAAAIALGELGDRRAIAPLQQCLSSRIWDLQYAALMALATLGEGLDAGALPPDADWLVKAKAKALL